MGRAYNFMHKLRKGGGYAPIVESVCKDKDLDMEFRGNCLNVYYKGNSILDLDERGGNTVHPNIKRHVPEIPTSLEDKDTQDAERYVGLLPKIKYAVTKQRSKSTDSLEREYEQLIIRANNFERRNNSEYIILDRQYAGNKKDQVQFDLVAVKWPRENRNKNHTGYLALIEVKYALNSDIQDLAKQIERYYSYLSQGRNMKSICEDMQKVLRQKLELGLVSGTTKEQRDQLGQLTIDTNLKLAETIIYLIDYNPNSTLFARAKPKLTELPFARQILIAYGGFAMWDQGLKPLD